MFPLVELLGEAGPPFCTTIYVLVTRVTKKRSETVQKFEIELDKYMGDEMFDFWKFRCRVKLRIYNYVHCNKRYGLKGSEPASINILFKKKYINNKFDQN